jgi:hypothetical protein
MARIDSSATLNGRIRELAQYDPDPSVITEKILAEIDYVEARAIAELTLREHVRHVVGRVPPIREGRPRKEATYTTADGQRTPSPHVAGVRDHWVSMKLMTVLQVGPRRNIYLRDATPANLLWAVRSREAKAAFTLAEAARHQRAHDELCERGLSCVAELSDEVITAVYRH